MQCRYDTGKARNAGGIAILRFDWIPFDNPRAMLFGILLPTSGQWPSRQTRGYQLRGPHRPIPASCSHHRCHGDGTDRGLRGEIMPIHLFWPLTPELPSIFARSRSTLFAVQQSATHLSISWCKLFYLYSLPTRCSTPVADR